MAGTATKFLVGITGSNNPMSVEFLTKLAEAMVSSVYGTKKGTKAYKIGVTFCYSHLNLYFNHGIDNETNCNGVGVLTTTSRIESFLRRIRDSKNPDDQLAAVLLDQWMEQRGR